MRILVAYDASEDAARAVRLVADGGWPAGASVRVVTVLEPLVLPIPATPAALLAEPVIESELLGHLRAELDGVVTRLAGRGLDVHGDVVRGRPADVLVDEAARFGADLVVVGSRGLGSMASLVLGSVSAELVVRAPCPVLVARRPSLRRVLLATDGSASALHAEELVGRWPVLRDAAIRVLSVIDIPRPWHTGIAPTMYSRVAAGYARDVERLRGEHEAIVEEAVARLAAAGLAAESSVRAGDAPAEIVAEAAAWGADAIVVGSHGRTGLARILLGSVARNVVQGTDASVIVARLPG